ncbi:MAG: STAS domain-containing protein [Gemmobacter sp.]
MQIGAERTGDTLVARVAAERIDAAVAIQFKDRMRDVIGEPAPVVILDLSRVGFLDSSGLGALVAVMKLLEEGRRLELAGLTPMVRKVLRLTRMDSVFTIHDTPPPRPGRAG